MVLVISYTFFIDLIDCNRYLIDCNRDLVDRKTLYLFNLYVKIGRPVLYSGMKDMDLIIVRL